MPKDPVLRTVVMIGIVFAILFCSPVVVPLFPLAGLIWAIIKKQNKWAIFFAILLALEVFAIAIAGVSNIFYYLFSN